MRAIRAGATVCAVMMLAACGSAAEEGASSSTDVGTTTTTSAPPPTTTTTAPPTSTLVPAAEAPDLLLKRGELGEIIGDTDLVELEAYTGRQSANVEIEPFACRSRALAAETGLMKDPTIMGNANRGAGGQSVDQMVAIYENPADITDSNGVMWLIDEEWRDCPDGDIFFIEVEGKDQRWVPYPISTGPDRIGTTFQRDGRPRNCHHVVAHRANVLAEVIVCGDGDNTAPANTVADRILAKVPS